MGHSLQYKHSTWAPGGSTSVDLHMVKLYKLYWQKQAKQGCTWRACSLSWQDCSSNSCSVQWQCRRSPTRFLGKIANTALFRGAGVVTSHSGTCWDVPERKGLAARPPRKRACIFKIPTTGNANTGLEKSSTFAFITVQRTLGGYFCKSLG